LLCWNGSVVLHFPVALHCYFKASFFESLSYQDNSFCEEYTRYIYIACSGVTCNTNDTLDSSEVFSPCAFKVSSHAPNNYCQSIAFLLSTLIFCRIYNS
jgi:hypothetical protein